MITKIALSAGMLLLATTACLGYTAQAIAENTPATPPEIKYPLECKKERHLIATARIQEITDADQAERAGGTMNADSLKRDLEKRKEIAGFFAEGCLLTGDDFFNAALVFQHGSVPDHYYQTWLWSKRAADLGHKKANWLIPRAVDRYLGSRGFKQLYGTQFYGTRTDDGFLWCLSDVASGISDEAREKIGVRSLAEAAEQVAKMNEGPLKSIEDSMCHDDKAEPPKGIFPGVY